VRPGRRATRFVAHRRTTDESSGFSKESTAPRLLAPGHTFPWKKAGLNPRSLRSDRILQEIYATGGDVRRICDLFGLTIGGASRYAATLGHPSFHEEIAGPHSDLAD